MSQASENQSNFSWHAYKANAECDDWLKPGLPIGEIGVRISKERQEMVDISIQECFEIATGANNYKRGGVLYLQARIDEFTFGKHCSEINAGLGFSNAQQEMASANFLVWNMCNLWPRMPLCTDNKKYPLEEALKNLILEVKFFDQDKLRLILIDNLTYFMEGDIECATDMVETMNAIRHIATSFNCACIFLHSDIDNDSPVLYNNICYGESIRNFDKKEMTSITLKDGKPLQKPSKFETQLTKWYVFNSATRTPLTPYTWRNRATSTSVSNWNSGKRRHCAA